MRENITPNLALSHISLLYHSCNVQEVHCYSRKHQRNVKERDGNGRRDLGCVWMEEEERKEEKIGCDEEYNNNPLLLHSDLVHMCECYHLFDIQRDVYVVWMECVFEDALLRR